MYVSEKVAITAVEPDKVISDFAQPVPTTVAQTDIQRSVLETLTHFEVRGGLKAHDQTRFRSTLGMIMSTGKHGAACMCGTLAHFEVRVA
jgi:hypothetical protein